MLEVGFTELLLIGVVALLVMGPERFPKAARTAGMWLGKGRRMLRSVRDEIEQELHTEELKKVIEEQKKSAGLHEIVEDTSKTINELKEKTGAVVKDATESPPAKQSDDESKGA